jgi:hypothetical protein
MKKTILIFTFLLSLALVSSAHASTRVSDDTIDISTGHVVWDKAGSPYVLDTDVYLPPGISLTIEHGVNIIPSDDISTSKSIFINGNLHIDGVKDDPVSINGLSSIYVSHGSSSISYLIATTTLGFNFNHATTTISSSIFTGALSGNAISARASSVVITDSKIMNNKNGIYSYYMPSGPALAGNAIDLSGGIGGEGNAFIDSPTQNHILISSSTIRNNFSYDIYNQTSNTLDARNNWWGSSFGPATTTDLGGTLFGPIDVFPWLTKNPDSAVCCSNVLFLPGMEASRLYLDSKGVLGGIFGTSTNTLWEPNRNDDVRKLFMDNSGNSLLSGVYTKDVIDSVFGFGIYKNFITMMDRVVADKTINAWRAFPYDWRFDADNIVSDSLLEQSLSLASTSKTKQISIVAHSNGGLVAKMLIKKLSDRGFTDIIDKVVFVAVPQLGTPQAIAALLHGDEQSIAGGLLLKQSVARDLGKNAPGGYGLLPSKSYFESAFSSGSLSSIISFPTSTITNFHFAGNTQTISTYDALRVFLADLNNQRRVTSSSDVEMPATLHQSIIDSAQQIHTAIDGLLFSTSTEIVSIAGWGNTTLAGIHYLAKKTCSSLSFFVFMPTCNQVLGHTADKTIFGDGTVILASALIKNIPQSKNYYFNLAGENKGKLIKDSHASILNTDSINTFVKNEITSRVDGTIPRVLPAYISDKAPTEADLHNDDLVVTIHSPVELHVYDSLGRHTGLIPNPDATSDLQKYETGIPGSSYYPDEENTHISLPYSTDYQIVFDGIGTGSFSVDVERDTKNQNVTLASFTDLPVTPLLKAELILAPSITGIATSTNILTPQILLDFDGNGIIDASSTPSDAFDPLLHAQSVKAILSSLYSSSTVYSSLKKKGLLEKIDRMLHAIQTGKKEKIHPHKDLDKSISTIPEIHDHHWKFKDIDVSQKKKLTDMYEAALDAVDVE